MNGTWSIPSIDGADVRLRSGRIGLVTVDVTAPVRAGELTVADGDASLTLTLALDQLRTRNFIMQAAARTLVTQHRVHDLTYVGAGTHASPMIVMGVASAGDIAVDLGLTITPVGPADDPMAEIELVGSANVGTVHLPLPGMGTVEDFAFDVDARLRTRR